MTTWTTGETEWAQRIATLEHMLAEERARVAELEAEAATLRHSDVLLRLVHGALADMCCRVPTSLDEPVDAIIRASLSRANQRFVDEYDARTAAESERDEIREELFGWQHAVEYVLGDDWCSADGHDAKAARKALADWAARMDEQIAMRIGDVELFKKLYEEQIKEDNEARAELKARIAVLEAMKP